MAKFVFAIFLMVLSMGFAQESIPKNPQISILASKYADLMKAIPDSKVGYTCVWNKVLKGSIINVDGKSNLITGSFEYCKQGEMFYVKEFDGNGKLTSQVSFNGDQYYCYIKSPHDSNLWIGPAEGIIEMEMLVKLSNSPFYANIAPLHYLNSDNFGHSSVTKADHWEKLLAKYSILKVSDGYRIERKVGSRAKVTIEVDANLSPRSVMTMEGEDQGRYQVINYFKGGGVRIPQAYLHGQLDNEGNPTLNGALTKVDVQSFALAKGLTAADFSVPKVLADTIHEKELEVSLREE